MAAGITELSTPRTNGVYGSMGDLKYHAVNVAGDTSYPTGGYVLTAAQLNMQYILGAILLNTAKTTAGVTEYDVAMTPATNGVSLAVQLYTTTAATAPLTELASTSDAHLYTAMLLVIGW